MWYLCEVRKMMDQFECYEFAIWKLGFNFDSVKETSRTVPTLVVEGAQEECAAIPRIHY